MEGEGGGKDPIPSWCFSSLADLHTCAHTHTLEGSELERDKRQMGEVGKGCCSNKLYQVKLRFNLMLPGYKTGSVTDNKCVA